MDVGLLLVVFLTALLILLVVLLAHSLWNYPIPPELIRAFVEDTEKEVEKAQTKKLRKRKGLARHPDLVKD